MTGSRTTNQAGNVHLKKSEIIGESNSSGKTSCLVVPSLKPKVRRKSPCWPKYNMPPIAYSK